MDLSIAGSLILFYLFNIAQKENLDQINIQTYPINDIIYKLNDFSEELPSENILIQAYNILITKINRPITCTEIMRRVKDPSIVFLPYL